MALVRFLAPSLLVLAAACGGPSSDPAGSDPTTGGDTAAGDTATLGSDTDQRVRHSAAQLIPMRVLERLPSPTRVETPGYPGRGFRVGVFDAMAGGADAWTAFSAEASISGFPEIDWQRQIVAYAVFDGQTNDVALHGFSTDGSTGVLAIDWDGIEPHYEDATPAVIAVIDVANLDTLRFELADPSRLGGQAVLGSVSVTRE